MGHCLLGPVPPPPPPLLKGPVLGGVAPNPAPVTAQGWLRDLCNHDALAPPQVSWAAPSRLSDTAPTISKSSTISEAPSHKVPPALCPPWCPSPTALTAAAASTQTFAVTMGGGGGTCQPAVGKAHDTCVWPVQVQVELQSKGMSVLFKNKRRKQNTAQQPCPV